MTTVDTRGPVTESEAIDIAEREERVLDAIVRDIIRDVAKAPGRVEGARNDYSIRIDRETHRQARKLVREGFGK